MGEIKVLVSVSGGRTSAVMAKLLKDKFKLMPVFVFGSKGTRKYTKYVSDTHEFIFVYANTSREDRRTLIFIDNIKKYWGIDVIWIEAVVKSGRVGTSFKLTDFNKAKQDGSVFESVIAKYGIPNKVYLHCTRELKAQPITAFAKSIGWLDYTTCIGYRFDEPKRVNLINAKKNNQWYPLFEWQVIKQDVLSFFNRQPFDLGLEEFEGNCRLCHKKSKRKLLMQIASDPESAEWVKDMENKYRYFQKAGRNNSTITDGTLFFRDNESIYDLIRESKLSINPDIDIDLDEQESCAESCEPFQIN